MLALIYPALIAGVVLSGIHAYTGFRFVERGVIFGALVLTQLAALGSAAAALAGYEPHSAMRYLLSLTCTTLGAALLTLVSREALLAIAYAAAAVATEYLSSRIIRDDASANILTVSMHTVAKTAAVYAGVSIVLFLFRRTLPDFAFYTLAGIVVTASVAIGGVLLAFVYVIAPAVIAILWSTRPGVRLAIAWLTGILVTIVGVVVGFKADLPTGAAIICTFGIVLSFTAIRSRIPDSG